MSLVEALPTVEDWPPSVDEHDIPGLNALYRRRGALRFSFGDAPATLTLAPNDDLPVLDGPAFRISIDDTVFDMRVPSALLERVVAPLALKRPLEKLDPEAAALLLEAAVADDLERLETALGAEISIVSRNDATFLLRGYETAARLERDGATYNVRLWLGGDMVARLGRALDCLAAPIEPIDVPQTVRVCMGWRSVPVAGLKDLGVGDVIIVESGKGMAGPVAVVGDRLAARLSVDRGRLVAAAGLAPLRGTHWEWTMESKTETPARLEGLDDAEIDQLPVHIVFELGRTEMSLGDVRRIGSGTVIPLARALDEAVDVVANGRRIGRGSIVRIGDSVGIRVERLTTDG